jgi:hypothetical protein
VIDATVVVVVVVADDGYYYADYSIVFHHPLHYFHIDHPIGDIHYYYCYYDDGYISYSLASFADVEDADAAAVVVVDWAPIAPWMYLEWARAFAVGGTWPWCKRTPVT